MEMQSVCCYLIICPDIVNAIRLCWSLVAERKGEKKSHFWDRKTAGFWRGGAGEDGNEEEELSEKQAERNPVCFSNERSVFIPSFTVTGILSKFPFSTG